jgi:hypothetical protein
MAAQTASTTQSDMRSSTAGHTRAVIRVYDETGNVIETHEHAGDFKEWLVAIPRRHAHTSSLGFHTQLSDQHFQASAGRDTNRLAVLQ